MDKHVFDIIQNFQHIENELYFKMEKELGVDKADEYLNRFVDYREKILKIGKYLDDSLYIGKSGYLTEKYNEIQRYTKLEVIYNYDNGYSLSETTSGLILLSPTATISFEKE